MYGKLFVQMYDGTLTMRGPWQALVTFQQLIILADRDGVVDMTPDAIARRTTIPIAIIEIGLSALAQPDPESRTPDEEGRRIVLLNPDRTWGWRVVNHAHYRKIRTADERRAYHREYARRRRQQKSQHVNPMSTESTNSSKQEAVSRSKKDLKARKDPKESFSAADEKPSDSGTAGEPWTKQAIDLYRAHIPVLSRATRIEGRICGQLQPFVTKDGAAEVLQRWETFCKVGRHYGLDGKAWHDPPLPLTKITPELFRDTYALWARFQTLEGPV